MESTTEPRKTSTGTPGANSTPRVSEPPQRGDKTRPTSMDRQILQELIYERIRLSINLYQLVLFEQDLERSIERAMNSCSQSDIERKKLAREYVDAAWSRVKLEWERLRDDREWNDDVEWGNAAAAK